MGLLLAPLVWVDTTAGTKGQSFAMAGSRAGFQNQIVVLVRFSHVSIGGSRRTPKDVEAAAQFVYDPARLTRRFELFEAVCLPTLARQSDQDFKLVIVCGDAMPAPFTERLMDQVAAMPNALVAPVHPGHSYWSLRRGLSQVAAEGASHRTTVRLDDDDGLDLGFVARLRAQAARLWDPDHPARDFAIAHNRGLYLDLAATPRRVFDAVERAPLSAGLALVAPMAYKHNVYHVNHRAIATAHDTFIDARTPSYLRTVHGHNDSGLNASGVTEQLDEAQIEALLRTGFGFDLDRLRAI
jgi:hypothetical protein